MHGLDLSGSGQGRVEGACECMDWIDLAQDRDGWRAPVNAVMEFLFCFILLRVLISILRVL
jgi:hypothetical protein